MALNVNCSECGWCEEETQFDENGEIEFYHLCTAFFPTVYEVDVINNCDCPRFRSKK